MQTSAPGLFSNHEEEIRVPFTSSIKDCNICHSTGKIECDDCHGDGYKACSLCHGSGSRGEESCTRCDATGKERCSDCSAKGTKRCDTCEGKRQLLTYIKLKVEWNNHLEDHVVQQNSGGVNIDDLSSVSGKELFKNNQYLVYPLLGFPLPAISEASERLVREHQSKYAQTSRILQQRQTVELIPVTKVNYKWKSDSHVYYVYGNEHQVSAENYPATCCCVVQ